MKKLLAILAFAGVMGMCADAPVADHALVETLVKKFAPSWITVHIAGQSDERGFPVLPPSDYLCPGCGGRHGTNAKYENGMTSDIPGLVCELPGAGVVVLAQDIHIRPPYARSIQIQVEGKNVDLVPDSYYLEQNAVAYKPADGSPLPLPAVTFQNATGIDLYGVYSVTEPQGHCNAGIKPISFQNPQISMDTNEHYVKGAPGCLLVDKDGNALTVQMSTHLAPERTRISSIRNWQRIPATQYEQRLQNLTTNVATAFFPVHASLATDPRHDDSNEERARRRSMFQKRTKSDNDTEFDAIGMLLPDGRLLVFRNLHPNDTARLVKLEVSLPDGKKVDAHFAGAFRRWGMFLATTDTPLPGKSLPFFSGKHAAFAGTTLFNIGFLNAGNVLDVENYPETIFETERGHSNQIIAHARSLSQCEEGDIEVNWDGSLVLVRVSTKIGTTLVNISAEHLTKILKENDLDPENIPRPEDERIFTADFGTEVQLLTRELARANGVSLQTHNGTRGLLVTDVRANTSAAEIGLKPGDVLMYFRMPENGIAIDPRAFQTESRYRGPFPWAQLSRLPERYFDELPLPWGDFETPFKDFLTERGIGSELEVAFLSNGKLQRKTFKIRRATAYYKAAPRFVVRDFGITVANITPDLRDYFRMKDDAPGVVISRVLAGGRASTAGIKPFELILSVDGKEVHNVAEFEQQITGKTGFDLVVRRLNENRVVKITK
ncbi:MAG: PDZ domain-containing protein [Victivallales bacterium]|nr:PDZ domain-containing protein [Victivallales bacterium]